MKITFIGSGNVATHLALAFYTRGHVINQVWSRNYEHAQRLACRVEAQPINDFENLDKSSNIYIVAVKDDALFDVALDLQLGDALVLHTSGSTSIDVLKSTSTRYGVIWSPQSFFIDVAMEYNELPFCIEGSDPETEATIDEFIGMTSQHIYHISYEQRQYLHLAAVMVNNFTNGLCATAQQICREHEMPFDLLVPIVTTTAKRTQYADVRYQITGPAARRDEKTIKNHRHLIKNDKAMLELYDFMTKYIQNIK